MPLTQYYHVRDSIENLLISVTLRKVEISGCGIEASKDSVPIGRTWRYRFRWQEKKLNTGEKKQEQDRLEAKGIQLASRRRKSSDSDASDILSSYVDVEDFIPTELVKVPLSTSSSSTHLVPPDLNRRPRNSKQSNSWTTNRQRAWERSNREDKFRAMHIVALIEKTEHVLCSLRFYKESGLLCCTPGFSTPIVDFENDPDLLIKGPKLTTYQLKMQSGCLYEFVLDNINDLVSYASAEDQRLTQELRLQEEKRDEAEVARWQNIGKRPACIDGVDCKTKKMMLSLEIVSIENPQTTDPIFIEYEFTLPDRNIFPQWRFDSENLYRRRGTTALSRPQRTGYLWWTSSASFGWHQFFKLNFVKESTLSEAQPGVNKEDDIADPPTVHFSIFSRDSWQRKRTEGCAEHKLRGSSGFYEFDVPIRKPILSVRDQMEELFIGKDENNFEAERSDQRDLCSEVSPISSMITSRLGQKSESTSSTIRIRYNVVELKPPKRSSAMRSYAIAATSRVGIRVVKRSVQEILQSVKMEKRISSTTNGRVQAAIRFIPSGGAAAAATSTKNNHSLAS